MSDTGSVFKATFGQALSPAEAAAVFDDVRPALVLRWIELGRFPGATAVDGVWHIPTDEVLAAAASGDHATRLGRLPGPRPMEVYEGDPLDLI